MSGPETPHSADDDLHSRIATTDRLIESLTAILAKLDQAGFEMSAIHVNDAIEQLRFERAKLFTDR